MINERKILEDVYNDFFSKEAISKQSDTKLVENDVDYFSKINELNIDDESIELLKKIIIYMEKYSKNEEKNYINFNITIDTNDKNSITKIIDILSYYAIKYKYIDKKKYSLVSFYKLNKEDSIINYYNENGIVILDDLDALNMNDTVFIKKFFYLFTEQLTKKQITIIAGDNSSIKKFLENDDRLSRDYFIFNIKTITPNINEIYNEVLSHIDDKSLDSDFNIRLLDYITYTFPKTDLDYTTYINNLYKYISFNKKLPILDNNKPVEEVFKELNELVGLESVKQSLNDLVNLITLKNKTKDDLKINNINLHMVFLGNPGTGKTTVARMIASILYDLKYIKQNKLIEVSSKDLVAEYVGQTSIKTMNVIEKAKGGVLFIDEAYSLSTKNSDNSYNADAIATLIKAMEDYRDDLVVIFAGYKKEMQDFLDSNSGILSRIGYTLEFEDYSVDELISIFKNMVSKSGFLLDDDAVSEIEKLIVLHKNDKNFGNARFIRNVYEKAIINHASNTKNNTSKKILKTITSKDIKYD